MLHTHASWSGGARTLGEIRAAARRRGRGRRPRLGLLARIVVATVIIAGMVLLAAEVAHADITLLNYPQSLVALNDTVTVTWQESVECRLVCGRAPGSYTQSTLSTGSGSLSFAPYDEYLAPGVWYCALSGVSSGERSSEFRLIVESPIFATPTSPPNGSVVAETTTELTWDAVDNVPYYYVAVSDHEIEIEEVDGELTVGGASLIWQALTSETSIQYGGVDPSGYFTNTNGESPPLMDGLTYNWLIFNCYGNDPLLTSIAGAGLAGFTTDLPTDLSPPQPTWPPDDVTITADIVDLAWEPVDGAVAYHVYIYETRDLAGGDASYPVWDGATTAPTIEVGLGSILVSGSYTWRIVALDDMGRGSFSELRSFDYATETGTAQIRTFHADGGALPRVLVDIEHSGGGVNVLPAITNENGVFNKELLPGTYAFHASKEDYVDTTLVRVIEADEPTYVGITLRRAPARVRGRVLDEAERPVFGATVTAECGGTARETETDVDGHFALQLTAGEWTISAARYGYAPASPQTIELAAGEYGELDEPLVLVGTPGAVSGEILNAAGRPLAGAQVRAVHAELGAYVTVTNCAGHFELELAPASWLLSASKAGYQSSAPRECVLSPGENLAIDPPVQLLPIDSAIMGRVTSGGVDVEGARVVAAPAFGEVVEILTNCYGEFLLMPPPGTYELRATHDGFTPSDIVQISVEAGESFTGVVLDIAPLSSTLAGRVVSGTEGVADARVTNGRLECLTGPDGEFAFDVGHGLHRLQAERSGYFSARPVEVATAPTQTIEGLTLELSPGACTVLGAVRSGPSVVPFAKVVASSGEASESAACGPDGRYELRLDAGTWRLTAEKPGFAPADGIELVLSPGETAGGVDLELDVARALVRGSVTDSRGGVSRADVLVARDDGVPCFRTRTNTAGGYSAFVEPGRPHRVTVVAAEHGSVTFEVESLSDGETAYRPVTLPVRRARLTGRVTSAGEPVAGALVQADWGETDSSITNFAGAYEMWLDDGLYDLTVTAPGYAGAGAVDVAMVSGETTIEHFEMPDVFARVAGSVSDSLTGVPVEGTLVTAFSDGGAASIVSSHDGSFLLEGVVPGPLEIRLARAGYRDGVIHEHVNENGIVTIDATLFPLDGTVSGRVTMDDGVTAVQSVAVRAKAGDEVVSSDVTDADGFFAITGLAPAASYDVHASRVGYYHLGVNPLPDVESGTTGLAFTMMPSDGVIEGTLTDATSGDPLEGATVEANDGAGHFGSAMTASDGTFSVEGLMPVGRYEVTASLYGYVSAQADSAECGERVDLALERNFARIEGTLTVTDGAVSVEDVEVAATNTSYAGATRVAVPDAAGVYVLADLRPGSYVLTADELGCVTAPPQVTLTLGEGDLVSGLDFAIETAVLDRVEVSGDQQVEAGSSVVFSATAVSDDGQLVDTGLAWWISPADAGEPVRDEGVFAISESYIGEFTVGAADTLTGLVGRLSGSVQAIIEPTTTATYADSTGMTIAFPSGCVAETKTIELTHDVLPDAKRCTRDLLIAGADYHLKPHGVTFSEGVRPVLSLPLSGDEWRLVRWDRETLEWIPMDAERFGDSVEATIPSLSEFAIASPSRSLGIADVRAEPNPFSPENGPVTISFELESREARTPFVTVRIHTMTGQLVRELVTNEPMTKGRAEATWDGLTDAGESARNGRYVVAVSAEDASGTAETLATVVLVK